MKNPVAAAFILPGLCGALSGCLVRTAADVVTAPVRVVAKGADWATTSQSEADEKRGRNLRRQEERLGKLDRSYRRHSEQCRDGDQASCDQARADYEQMQELSSAAPGRDD